MRDTQNLFIPPETRIDSGHPDIQHFAKASKKALRDRWATSYGQGVLGKLLNSQFERELMEQSVGRLYDQLDLRGIPLPKQDLSRKDLHNVDFYAADLNHTSLFGSDLRGAYFSEANIKGADFSFCKMDDAFLDNSSFDIHTKFVGVDIRKVNFNLAMLLEEQARSQQRIAHLEARHRYLALFLRWSCNYGQSLALWMGWVVAVIVGFAAIYSFFPGMIKAEGLGDALYFSVVTFTTLGYGDITPLTPIAKALVATEVVIGYLMSGLLISILTRRLIGT